MEEGAALDNAAVCVGKPSLMPNWDPTKTIRTLGAASEVKGTLKMCSASLAAAQPHRSTTRNSSRWGLIVDICRLKGHNINTIWLAETTSNIDS